jgi:hypothetical protein
VPPLNLRAIEWTSISLNNVVLKEDLEGALRLMPVEEITGGGLSEALVLARRRGVQLIGEIEVQGALCEQLKKEADRSRERVDEVLGMHANAVNNGTKISPNPNQGQADLHHAKATTYEAQAYAAYLRVEQARMEFACLLQQYGG